MKSCFLKYFFPLLAIALASSCTEKELLMPHVVQDGESSESLTLRPSLRPSEVQVYPAFYNTVEIVFPEEQPERAVSASIAYLDVDNNDKSLEITDFSPVIVISDIKTSETAYTIHYYTSEGKASKPVVFHVTPYGAVPDYVYDELVGYGKYGVVNIHWKNITTKEVFVEVNYIDNGEQKTISKTSSSELDTIQIAGLPNVETVFEVKVTDPEKEVVSEIKTLSIAPGVVVQNVVMSSFEILRNIPSNITHIYFENMDTLDPVDVTIEYPNIDGEQKVLTYQGVLNRSESIFIKDLASSGNIDVTVSSAIGEVSEVFDISTQVEVDIVRYEDRNTWDAFASSWRNGPSNPGQGPLKTLDGVFSEASSGSVTTTQWVNEWGNGNPDATGTPNNNFPHWIGFDMKTKRIITAVQTYNVGGGQNENGGLDFRIEISDNGIDWTTVEEARRTVFTRGGNEIFTLDTPVVTRYIRLYYINSSGTNGNLVHNGTIRIAEFYAWGFE